MGGDTTPPQLSIVEVWPDGKGNLTISVVAFDPESGIASVTITGNGIVTDAPMTYKGADVYTYTFHNISLNKIVNFSVTATNGVGLTATATGSSRSPKSFNFSKWQAQCTNRPNSCNNHTNIASKDPVLLSILNFVYEIHAMELAGPGQSNIDFTITYNSQNPLDGPYGQGMNGPYQMDIDVRDNELLQGVAVTYPDGHKALFTDQGGGTFECVTPGVFDQLKKQGDGYVLTTYELTQYEFNVDGQLTLIRDTNNNQIRFQYSGDRLTRIENDGGRWINLSYNGDGRVSALDGPEGKHVEFGYSGPAMTSFTDLNGETWTYKYDIRDNGTFLDFDGQPYHSVDYWMTEVQTPKGHDSVKSVYNDIGEVIEQWVGDREHSKFSRDEGAHTTTVIDAYNKTTKYKFDDQWRVTGVNYPDGSNEAFGYDDDFNRTFWRDRTGKEWHYVYDGRGNIQTQDGPLGYHRAWDYHPTFNKPVSAAEKVDGSTTRTWTFGYDSAGNMTSICNPYDCGSVTYNARGLPETITDFARNTTTNTYDAEWDLETTTNGEGDLVTFGTDDAGRTTSVTNASGDTFHYTFSHADQLTAIDGPMNYHVGFEYDPNGNLAVETDANGGQTVYTFNKAEKLSTIQNQNKVVIATYGYGDMNELKSFIDGESRHWTYDNDTDQRIIGMHGPLDTNITMKRDAVGHVTEITDAEGRLTKTSYDDLYRISSVVENVQSGKSAKAPDANITTRFDYNLVGDMLDRIDPEENTTIYQYDLLSRVIMVKDAENQETHFEYDPMGKLLLLTNPRTFTTRYTYDHANRLKTVTSPLPEKPTYIYAYNHDGQLSDITDPQNVVTHQEYDDLGRLAATIQNYQPGQPKDNQTNVTTTYEYDPAGNLKVVTNPLHDKATYTYDPAFRLTDSVDFAGGHTHYDYDKVDNLTAVTDDNHHITQYTIDALDRITRVTNPEGDHVSFTYNKTGALILLEDANGNQTHFTPDGLDRTVTMQDAKHGVWTYSYDRVGNILVAQDANIHETTFNYDNVYRLLDVTDAEGNITYFAWDPNSNLEKLTDGNGNPTDFVYDEADRLISVTNAEKETTGYEYNLLGYQTKLIEADQTATRYDYDPLYRLIAVTENERPGKSSNNDTNVTSRYVYDAGGNLTRFVNANGNPTKFEFDGMGRVTKETDPLDHTWKYAYDGVGNLTSRIDAKKNETKYSYYKDDQLQQISYFDGTTVKFEYDPNNNPTKMVDQMGVTTWKYDELNRVTDVTDALNRTLSFEYDPVDNRKKMTYPDGNQVTYSYLKNNWLQTITSPAGTSAYKYDGVGNVKDITNPNGTETTIDYDRVNRVTKLVNQQLHGAAKINSSFEYAYNEVGHVTSVTATYASQEETWDHGRRVGWQKHVQVKDIYGYDGLHRLNSAVRTGKQTGKGGQGEKQIGWKMSYEYDAVGNRTQWTTNDNPFTQNPKDNFTATYTYNEANQLTQARVNAKRRPDNVTVKYTYDENGNRTDKFVTPRSGLKTGTSYSYDPENRLVTAQNYQINGRGRTINRAITTLGYDGLGRRLTQTYDPKTGKGGAKQVQYTFDGLDPVVETKMWNKQYDNYYRGAMGHISVRQHFPAGTEGQMYWYDYNAKGDVTGLSKQDGQSIHNYQYDPYGGVIPDKGSFTDPHNHYTLTGKEYDEHTGLVYFGARHYDPSTAQWMTQDTYRGTIANPMSLHRYMYNYANPVSYVDWYGFSPNQNQIATIDYWVRWVAHEEAKLGNNPSKEDRRQILHKIYNDQILGDVNKTGQAPYMVDQNSYNNRMTSYPRYLYNETYKGSDCSSNYLDALHFFAGAYYASWTYNIPVTAFTGPPSMIPLYYYDPVSVPVLGKLGTEFAGWLYELGQCYAPTSLIGQDAKDSCNSPEDAPSNTAGADFGQYVDLSQPLAPQLEKFLKEKAKAYTGVNKTGTASILPPNYGKLPKYDN